MAENDPQTPPTPPTPSSPPSPSPQPQPQPQPSSSDEKVERSDTGVPVNKPDYETSGTERNPSTAELDLERRLRDDYVSPLAVGTVADSSAQPSSLPDDLGFVGIDPIYANFANPGEEPLQADGGVWAEAEAAHDDAVTAEATGPSDAVKGESERARMGTTSS